jgi:hypothetical protein
MCKRSLRPDGRVSQTADFWLKRQSQFDCFLTVDRNLQFQQNSDTLPIAVVVIVAVDNKFQTLQKTMTSVREALARIERGECITVWV